MTGPAEVPVAAPAPTGPTGLVDRDIRFNEPSYPFLGTFGSANVVQCTECGALVTEAFRPEHTADHKRVHDVMRYNGRT